PGGVQFSNLVQLGASAQYGQGENKFGVNYGGGIKFRVAQNSQVRCDIRQYETGQPNAQILRLHGRLFNKENLLGHGRSLLKAAVRINRALFDRRMFDIRSAGVVHAALFLLAFCLILPLTRDLSLVRRILVLLLLIIIFEDVMYVCLLNSFYMDAAAYLFL